MQTTDHCLWDTEQTAAFIKVRPSTLVAWRQRGDFGPTFLKLGRRVLYDPADVRRWLQCQRFQSTAAVAAAKGRALA